MSKLTGLFLAGAFAAVAGIGGMQVAYVAQPDTVVRATVNKTESVVSGKQSKYLVFTDKEVFENSDSFTRGKFNSSDVYNELQSGRTYDFTVFGFRNHPFSMYRNIVKAKPVVADSAGPK